MEVLDDGNFAIAIITPLMKLISSNFEESGEILFIDASGNVDRFGCKDFSFIQIVVLMGCLLVLLF